MNRRKKIEYETTTKTACLKDLAIDREGGVAAHTFIGGDTIRSNDYLIPFGAIFYQVVKTNLVEDYIDDLTCDRDDPPPPPRIVGAYNITINEGIGIDLREGVSAVDGFGNLLEYQVEPTEIEECDVGVHNVIYTTTDSYGQTTTLVRKVTIRQIDNPTINGLTDIVVEPNEEFNPLDGVTAVDGNGNPVEVEIKE